MIYILNSVCQNANVLKIFFYVKLALKFAFIIVPIGLIFKTIFDLYKNVISGSDDVIKENNKMIIRRVIATIIMFLVYPIVNLIFSLDIINQVGYLECWNNATSLSQIESLEKTLTLSIGNDIAIDGSDEFTCASSSCEFQLPIAYKPNYEFLGWSKSSSCSSLINDTIVVTEKNTTLYPCFSKKENESSGGGTTITKTNNTIFVGDSRTVQMCNYLKNTMSSTEQCVAKGSQEYKWFNNTAISQVNKILNKDSSKKYNIIIDLGVNGLYNGDASKYANKYNELKNGDWSKHNLIIVSVTPVDSRKYTNPKNYNTTITNFNKSLEQQLNNNIIYCDIYDDVLEIVNNDKSATSDSGLHYNSDTSKKIYNLKKNCIN